MTDNRSVRVFVSSTFRDFAAERDALATHAWPALRALCEDRAVTFTDVDLRWGITDEQAAEGAVLPICLAEIDASRPYFIGILGERYGWVPEAIPDHLVETMPWLSEHKTRSVTELEIAHGVLNDPEMAGRAFFYFRDPSYAQSVPEARRSDFLSEDEQAAAKLADLKERIRVSGLPLREGFSTPTSLVEQVVADLTLAIEEAYPEDTTPDPLARDRLAHEAYALSRRGVWIGRDSDLGALDDHAAGDGPPLVVTGASGGGKSALLANWAARYRAAHPDAIVIEHYCGASANSADWAAMCRRLARELSAATGVEADLPTGPTELRTAFKQALFRFAAGRRIVLVIDGLNQVGDADGAASLAWFPHDPPGGLRIIMSALPGRTVNETRGRDWTEFEIAPLQPHERTRLITEYLASFAKRLPEDLASAIASARQAANPLFVRVLLDELRVAADHEHLRAAIDRYLQADGVDDLYELVLERWDEEYNTERPDLVKDAMSAIWAARRGLSESEILGILGGDGPPLPRAVFSPVYLAARTALLSKSGVLGFAHDFLRRAVEDRYVPHDTDKRTARMTVARWFEGQEQLAARTLDEYPWQLARLQAWPHLCHLLEQQDFTLALESLDPAALREYWGYVFANTGRHPRAMRHLNQDRRPVGLVTVDLLRSLGRYGPALRLARRIAWSAVLHRDLEATFRVTVLGERVFDEAPHFHAGRIRSLYWDLSETFMGLAFDAGLRIAVGKNDQSAIYEALQAPGSGWPPTVESAARFLLKQPRLTETHRLAALGALAGTEACTDVASAARAYFDAAIRARSERDIVAALELDLKRSRSWSWSRSADWAWAPALDTTEARNAVVCPVPDEISSFGFEHAEALIHVCRARDFAVFENAESALDELECAERLLQHRLLFDELAHLLEDYFVPIIRQALDRDSVDEAADGFLRRTLVAAEGNCSPRTRVSLLMQRLRHRFWRTGTPETRQILTELLSNARMLRFDERAILEREVRRFNSVMASDSGMSRLTWEADGSHSLWIADALNAVSAAPMEMRFWFASLRCGLARRIKGQRILHSSRAPRSGRRNR